MGRDFQEKFGKTSLHNSHCVILNFSNKRRKRSHTLTKALSKNRAYTVDLSQDEKLPTDLSLLCKPASIQKIVGSTAVRTRCKPPHHGTNRWAKRPRPCARSRVPRADAPPPARARAGAAEKPFFSRHSRVTFRAAMCGSTSEISQTG